MEKLNPREFELFCRFIYEQSGIRIGDRKVSLLSNRIRRRLKACEFSDFDSYYRYLTSSDGSAELEYFLDAVTTNETLFFRTDAHFEWFRTELINEVVGANRSGNRDAVLRIWSAACASGAEPYSIAICLAEHRFQFRDWSVSILGTDISEQEIAKAREGVFSPRAVEALSDAQKRRFFSTTNEEEWQVKAEVKEAVTFARHNLMQPMDQMLFDCIFLCNVLIYFDGDSKRTVVDNVVGSLAEGGYLVVGPSEGVYDSLRSLQKVAPLVYRKPNKSTKSHSEGGLV